MLCCSTDVASESNGSCGAKLACDPIGGSSCCNNSSTSSFTSSGPFFGDNIDGTIDDDAVFNWGGSLINSFPPPGDFAKGNNDNDGDDDADGVYQISCQQFFSFLEDP